MTDLLRDTRLALRVLARSPSFTIVTIVTLAVAIGANTAIFSVVDGVLLRPLAYPEPDRIVTVAAEDADEGIGQLPFSDRGFWFFVNENKAYEQFGGYTSAKIPLVLPDAEPLQINAGVMTRGAYDVLGVAPIRGRLPSADEDKPGAPFVVLLGESIWQSRFGGDPEIIGKSIDLNGQQREVIGIMPDGYDFPSPEIDVWVPYRLDPASPNFGGHHISGLARLRDGVTPEAAKADGERLIARFAEVGYGPEWFPNVFTGKASVRSYKEQLVGDARRPLLILLGTVGFVLLIACSNIANLFLLRAEGRTRETAVRIALGAGRARVIRYVVVESLLLALAGGAAGVLLAYLGTQLLVAMTPPAIPRLHEIGITTNVLLFTLGISIFAGLLFGVLPALRSFSYRMVSALRDGGRGATVGRERHRIRAALVVTQVAMALLLLVGSGLMVRSFQQLRAVDPGFDADGLVTFQLSPPPSRYDTPEATAQFYDRLLEELRALPGVVAAGAVTQLPLVSTGGTVLATQVEDFPTPEGQFPPTFHVRRVTPGYFEAMKIPVIEGRAFEQRDHAQRLGSAIVSHGIKERFWKDRSALGRRIAPSSAPAAIVGVVGDVHQTGLGTEMEPTIYMPLLDSVGGGVRPMSVAIRTSANPLAIMDAARGVIRGIDVQLPITDVQTMGTVVSDSMSRTSFTALLLVIAAVVGLFLGAVGIYGVIAYTVKQRTTELGIRQALGASAATVRTLVLRQGVATTIIGIAIGLLGAAALARYMQSLLYGVSVFDPITFVGGPIVFVAVAMLACLIPAQRAASVAPSEALRAD